MQEKGQVQCVRLLESQAEGGLGGWFWGGWRSGGAEGWRGCVVRLGGCFVFAESDGIWQRSSALTWPTLTSHHPARPSGSKKQTQTSAREDSDTP